MQIKIAFKDNFHARIQTFSFFGCMAPADFDLKELFDMLGNMLIPFFVKS